MDVHHIRLGVEAILLSGEVVCERQRRKVTRSAERDAHVCCGWAEAVGLFEEMFGSSNTDDLDCRDVHGNGKPTFLCQCLSYVYNVLVERRSRVVM